MLLLDWLGTLKSRFGLSSRRRRVRCSRLAPHRPPLSERLENRILLTIIAWDGGAGTFNWNDAANWVGDLLPGAADDVVIGDLTGSPTITSGGTVTINSITSQEHLAVTGGTFTVFAASQLSAGLTLSAGSLVAGGEVTLLGDSSWTDGTITGSGSVENGGALAINAAVNPVTLEATTLVNTGVITHQAGTFRLNAGAIFDNQLTGVYNLAGDLTIANLSSTNTINNAGIFRKSAGAGVGQLTGSLAFNNLGGTVEVNAGTLSLRGGTSTGGTYIADAGTVLHLTGGGTQTYTGTHTGTGTGTIQIHGTSIINIGAGGATFDFDQPGLFRLRDGATLGAGSNVLTNTGSITIDPGAAGTVVWGGNIVNGGTITHVNGAVRLSTATINNQASAIYNFAGDASFGVNVAGLSTFNNAGFLQKSAGTGTSSFHSTLTLNNTGTVEVVTGTLTFNGAVTQLVGSTLTGGTWDVIGTLNFSLGSSITTIAAGVEVDLQAGGNFTKISTLNQNDGSFRLFNGGTFSTAGNFTNGGNLEVSNAKLTVNGNFTQTAAGTLYVSFFGTDPVPSDFSQLAITGTAALDGTLNAIFHFNYVADKADTFRILTYASRSGDFATKNVPQNNGIDLLVTDPQATFYDLAGTAILATNTNDSGAGSFRDALTRANAEVGDDLILFNLTGGGPYSINLLSALPTITGTVTIDGTFAEGFAGTPIVELNGTSAGAGVSGLTFAADSDGSEVRGLVINRFGVSGIVLTATSGVTIAGNYIGTDVTGSLDLGNARNGVTIELGAQDNTIARGNVISGNDFEGVLIHGVGTDNNIIAGNLIGTNAAGTAALGDSNNGVFIMAGAKNNRVGTNADGINDVGERNVISGVEFFGIVIRDVGTDGNVVAGNYIGTDVTGTLDLGNQASGVIIQFGATGNTIGGGAAGDANLISGNDQLGVLISGAGTMNNIVAGNFIGTDVTGTLSLGNSLSSIRIDQGASFNLVGTNADGNLDSAERNILSGNGGVGVFLDGSGTSNNVVAGNFIGTDVSGTAALGNNSDGIRIANGAANNRVGTNADGINDDAERNIISGSLANFGVVIRHTGSDGNIIAGNYIGTDVTGSIDLGNFWEGVAIEMGAQNNVIGGSSAGSGNVISGNRLEGITIRSAGTNGNIISGNLIGTNAAGTAAIANQGDGISVESGATNTVIGGDSSAERNVISGNNQSGIRIAGTGTDGNIIAGNYIGTDVTGTVDLGNTSSGVVIRSGAQNNTIGGGDTGAANLISGNDGRGVLIRGVGTSGNLIAGNFIGTDATGMVDLGNTLSGVVISAGASNNVIGGNSPGSGNLISGNNREGVIVSGLGSDSNIIVGNLIGTDVTGTLDLGNSINGVVIEAGAKNNRVGTDADGLNDVAERNVISGNDQLGIAIRDLGTNGNVVAGNYIGTDATGMLDLGNALNGVSIESGATDNTIGGNGSGVTEPVSAGDRLVSPSGIVIGTDGMLYVADQNAEGSGAILRIDRATGVQTVVSSGVNFVTPTDVLFETPTTLLVIDRDALGGNGALIRVNVATGAQTVVSSGGLFVDPDAIDLEADGNIVVADFSAFGGSGGIIRIDSTTGAQSVVSSGGNFVTPVDVIVGPDGDLYVADQDAITTNGAIFRVDAVTGAQTVIANGADDPAFLNPTGLAFEPDGSLLVIDSHSLVGSLFRVDAATGARTVLSNALGGSYDLVRDSNGDLYVSSPQAVGGPRIVRVLDKAAANVISGNDANGIVITGTGTSGNTVAGNFIGTDVAGSVGLGNSLTGINLGAPGNVIGGTDHGEGNLISGNLADGILIQTALGTGNVILGNFIGTDAGGLADLGNGGHGIRAYLGANENTIGGTAAGAGNVISGNALTGISLGEALDAPNHIIQGNIVGLGADGDTIIGNDLGGVWVQGSGNLIGGTDPGAGNVISGNTLHGLRINGVNAHDNLIAGNLIGTDATGMFARGNSTVAAFGSLLIENGASNNTIGGTTPAHRNVISGNTGDGVRITGTGTTGNSIIGNFIGTDATGAIALGNSGDGVRIDAGAANNQIGVADALLVGAGDADSLLRYDTNTDTLLDTFVAPGAGGLDGPSFGPAIGPDGLLYVSGGGSDSVVRFDPVSGDLIDVFVPAGSGGLDGANDVVFTADGDLLVVSTNTGQVLRYDGTTGAFEGVFISGPSNGMPSELAFGPDGNLYLGWFEGRVAKYDGTTGAALDDTFIEIGARGADVHFAPDGKLYVATYFGQFVAEYDAVTGALVRTIVSGDPNLWPSGIAVDDEGSIYVANWNFGRVHRYDLATSELLEVLETGIGRTSDLLLVSAYARNTISGNAGAGVSISGVAATGNAVMSNYIGTDSTGTVAIANLGGGVLIEESSDNTIGGPAIGAGNVISGNTGDGIQITGSAASGNVAAGNYIGTDLTGTAALGNTGNGVALVNAAGNFIGGSAAGERNIISGNGQDGVLIDGNGILPGGISRFRADGTANDSIGTNNGTAQGGTTFVPGLSGQAFNFDGTGYVQIPNNPSLNPEHLTVAGWIKPVFDGRPASDFDFDTILTKGTGTGFGYYLTVVMDPTPGRFFQAPPAGVPLGTPAFLVNVNGFAHQILGPPLPDDGQFHHVAGTFDGSMMRLFVDGVEVATKAVTGSIGSTNVDAYIGGQPQSPAPFNKLSRAAVDDVILADHALSADQIELLVAARGAGTLGNRVQGNYIGTDSTGTQDLGNAANGVRIQNGASGNIIGGAATAERNIISGNDQFGVLLTGLGTSNNAVAGNYIGTDVSGTLDRGNTGAGVFIDAGADSNTIGGETSGAGNLISGNNTEGVNINSDGNQVLGNFIGTTAAGTAALGNTAQGITISGSNNIIGGTTAPARNVISGNNNGIHIAANSLPGATGNIVQGNYIGTDVTGTVSLGLSQTSGVSLSSFASNNLIGGTAPGAGNLISGNRGSGGVGVWFLGGIVHHNTVQGNLIGTNAAGTAALSNIAGVRFGGHDNLIGGDTPEARNIISGNIGEGVLSESIGVINTVQGNFIGTDITGTRDLGNGRSGIVTGGPTHIIENLISGNDDYGIEIGGSTGHVVEGNIIGTNAAGTQGIGNTEGGILVRSGANNFTIGGTTAAQRNIISFNKHGIELRHAGTTSITIQGNYIGTDVTGTLRRPNSGHGVFVHDGAAGITVGGTDPAARNVIAESNASGWAGIAVSGTGVGGVGSNTIQGNFIGIAADGTSDIGGGGRGIMIDNSSLNIIGGTTFGARNVISGHALEGIRIQLGLSTGNTVQGNYIGTDVTGTSALGNQTGVSISLGANGNTIGGSTAGAGNLISGNTTDGVRIESGSLNNIVQGNLIGTNYTGVGDLGNLGHGILAGASLLIESNTVAFNALAGVAILASGVTVRGNRIHSNAGLGIDYLDDGVTVNGSGAQDFPTFTSVQGGGNTRVTGTISGPANVLLALDFYANTTLDPTGYGEGKRYLGSASVMMTPAGSASFDVTLPGFTVPGEFVTGTATAADGSTSEFSLAQTLSFSHPPTIENLLNTVLPEEEEDAPAAAFGIVTNTFSEGRINRLDGLFTDPDPDDEHTVFVDWGDGTTEAAVISAGFRGFSFEHLYPDDVLTGTSSDDFDVTVYVIDSDGASGVAFLTLTVENVAATFDGPLALTAAGSPVSTVAEGQPVMLSGRIADPGVLDTHTLEINWGDGSPIQMIFLSAGVLDFNVFHAFWDNSTSNLVTVTLRDDDSGVATAQTSLAVTNVVPVVFVEAPLALEGSPVTLTADLIDPGVGDSFSYRWVVKSGAKTVAAGYGPDITFTPKNSGLFSVELAVVDDDGGEAVAPPFTLVVQNVAPSIAAGDLVLKDKAGSIITQSIEGDLLTLAGSITDPGYESHSVTVTWGDGSPASTFTLEAGATSFTVKHRYPDDNPTGTASDDYVISITVTDADGAVGSQMKTITINNVPPLPSVLDDGSDGTTVRLRAAVFDPGVADTFHSIWAVTVDGQPVTGLTTDQPTLSFARPASGVATVRLEVTDDDGGQGLTEVLFVGGTDQGDTITIDPTANPGDDPNAVTVTVNAQSRDSGPVNAILISSGAGNDVITINAAVTTAIVAFAGAGDDVVSSGSGNDFLDGGEGADSLFGGDGNDTLTSIGDDSLAGGNQNDFYIVLGFSDKVLDEGGTTGIDTINFTAVNKGVTLDLGTTDTSQTATDDGDQITLKGTFENVLGSEYTDKLTGNDEQNLIFGGGGNDSLDGAMGDDSLDGGMGNDTLVGGFGNDTLISGEGNDMLDGGMNNDTLIAGEGNDDSTDTHEYGDDTLFGGDGNDLIFGGGGNDSLDGGMGDDTLIAGDGSSSLTGGDGNDSLVGGMGNDTLIAGDGESESYDDDTLFGGDGNDLIFGGGGNDSLGGGMGNDTLTGGGGNDVLSSGTGNDSLGGGQGNDTLIAGDDTLMGAQGNDSVNYGNDTLFGGDGNDLIFGGGGNDSLDGGRGNDSLVAGDGNSTMVGGDGNDSLTGGMGRDSLTGGSGDDTLIGGGGNDGMGGGNDTLFGGDGNDLIFGGGGNDSLDGGMGNDSLIAGNGNSSLTGGDGNDSLYGGMGHDILDGGAGDDTLIAADGNDSHGPGDDTLFGGDGNDLIFGGGGNDSLDGGRGNDTLVAGDGNTSLMGGAGNDSLYGGMGHDVIDGGSGDDTLIAGDGNDSQGPGDDTLFGGDGNDLIFGGGGNDSLDGGMGNDTLIAGDGNTLLSGGDGNDSLYGGMANDSLDGGSGDDTLIGGGGNDSLLGGMGDDTLIAGEGNDGMDVGDDTLFGGDGNDLIFGSRGAGLLVGGKGDDVIVGSGQDRYFGDELTGTGAGTDTFIFFADADIVLTNTTLTVGTNAPIVLTGFERVQLIGGPGNNRIDASLFTGDVALIGGPGDDTLIGGSGNDLLDGGAGDDLLIGGPGSDVYRFGADAGGQDSIIEDADSDADLLDFDGFRHGIVIDLGLTAPQVVGGNLMLTLSDEAGLEDVFGTAFADVISGNDRPNKLTGSGGADTLEGRGGDDELHADVTKVVYLDFVSATEKEREHDYTPEERAAIEERIASDYAAFDIVFTQERPMEGPLFHVIFNSTPIINGVPQPGGRAESLNWRLLGLSGTVVVDVNGFLGPQRLAPTSENFIALSSTIAAHELGHQLGLRHHDALGLIGGGLYQNVKTNRLLPTYFGPRLADETRFHLLASPAAVGTSLADAAGNPYFGEREAIKLAFAETGTTVAEVPDDLKAQLVNINGAAYRAQDLDDLVMMAVPMANGEVVVSALNVMGEIVLDPATGKSESDFYAFHGNAGDVVTIEIFSRSLDRIANPIDSLLRLYDANGQKVNYYGSPLGAFNDDNLELTDSLLLDVILPEDGAYFIEVDTFRFTTPEFRFYVPNFDVKAFAAANPTHTGVTDRDQGQYELFLYRKPGLASLAEISNPPLAGDILTGGAGFDRLVGSSGRERLVAFTASEDIFIDPSGAAEFVEGQASLRLSATNITEGSLVNATVTLPNATENEQVQIAWGDGQMTEATYQSGIGTYTASHIYTDNPAGPADHFNLQVFVNRAPSALASVRVTNVSPQNVDILIGPEGTPDPSQNQVFLDEGSVLSLRGVFTDPGADSHTYQWRVNGQMVGEATGSSFDFLPLQNGTYRITFTVTDDDGGQSSDTMTVFVRNVAPRNVAILGQQTVHQNTPATWTSSFADPGVLDTHTYAWSVKRGNNPYVLPAGTVVDAPAFSFTPDAAGDYTISLVVTDDDGASGSAILEITVTDTVPEPTTVSITGAPTTSQEGTPISLGSTVIGPGSSDSRTYAWSVTTNGLAFASGTNANIAFTPNDDGEYIATLTVTDNNGTDSDTKTIQVTNVRPQEVSAGADQTVEEGDAVDLAASFTDPGSADAHTFRWQVTASNGQVVSDGLDQDFRFVPLDNGIYTVLFTVADDDGGEASDSLTVTVLNADPTAVLSNNGPVDEGSLVRVSFTDGADASNIDAASLGYFFSTDQAARDAAGYVNAGSDTSRQFEFFDNGSYIVYGRVIDKDGGYSDYQTTVVVNNAPPVVAITGAPAASAEGTQISLGSTVSDPGTLDTHTYAWSVTKDGQAYVSGAGASYAFTPDDDGTFVVTLTATDKDGGVGTDSKSITVENVAPQNVEITGPLSGVRGQLLHFSGSLTDPGSADTYTFQWAVNGQVIAGATGPALDFLPTVEGSYTVVFTVTDDDGGTAISSRQVGVTIVAMQGNDLVVGGTVGNDDISFAPGASAGEIVVIINGVSYGSFLPNGRLIAFAQAGDDDVQVAGSITLSAWLYGDAGDDRIKGGSGHDVILGGTGNDLIQGGGGRDLLIGGTGADRIVGNADDDILIAGYTLYDRNQAALNQIMIEWTRTDRSNAQRVQALSNGLGGVVLNQTTVKLDSEVDVLTGSSGEDWFLFDLNSDHDRVTDLKDEAFLGDLDWLMWDF